MNSTKDSFEEILSGFKQRLTEKEIASFQFVTLDDVRETALRIQREQEELKNMKNMARLQSFLEATDQFGKVIEVFVNASSFVAFIWGPLKFILMTASTWADSFEAIMDAYGQIGDHMPLVKQYEELFGVNPYIRRVLALMYVDILDFHKSAIRFFSGRGKLWQQLFRSMWKDFGSRFKQILTNLSRHKALIIEQATLIHFQRYQEDSQKTLIHIQQYEQHIVEELKRMETQEVDEKHKKYLAILEWFSAAQTTFQDHDTFHDIRSQNIGSGDWILKEEKVQNWMELDPPVSSILWLNGIPGAGKTVLASAIIDGCLRDPSYTTSYFYCKENDPEKNDCISIFRGILSQLLRQYQELVPYCYDKYLSSGELILTTVHLAELLLKVFCEKVPKQYIIIDGLDECDPSQRRLVLSFFMKMVDSCDEREPGKLRVLFVSQNYPDIEKALKTAAVLKLRAEDNENDIKIYVRSWSKKIQEKHDLQPQVVEFIQESTCIRSQGMFLFAKLVMENLHAQETQMDLLTELRIYGFPKGLEEAYERIIRRMKKDLKDAQWIIARKLLGWMVCAKRPLKWREIQAAVSIDPDSQTIEFENRKLRSDVQQYCGSLIQVLPGDRIELVHTTAKMHIVQTGHVNVLTVECNLAALCLQYLTFECFDKDIDAQRLQHLTVTGVLSFQDYAVAKWLEHIHAIIKTEPGLLINDSDSHAALRDMNTALDNFADCYEDEILYLSLVEKTKDDCQLFKNYEFYDKLLLVWNHVYSHHIKGSEVRNDVSIKTLGDALFRNRKLLESLSHKIQLEDGDNNLATFYGEKRFKCPKTTCFYFHEGFKDAKSRDKHINRHDRPFSCSFPDCSIAEFGFASNKDLEKHMRFFHPDVEDQANRFAGVTKAAPSSKWECHLCGKRFTRGFQLRNHILSHSGERPYACSECGKAFTRRNDCKRHEKIHSRR